ncbi:MAG: 2-C-methyl-D-erythritol 4-phosphate cytidylyltransferase [Clostridia bacterium]|nr:2-C-methyl-D-erythritol 4-phosphate cytidylyltransferase [Clostridia bacterium]
MVCAAVLAGGSGLRMGGDLPKQFLCIGGRPVIIRSIDAFISSGLVDRIVVAVSADYIDYTKSLIAKFLPKCEIDVICGGKNRNETLYNVLKMLKESGIGADDVILTHDAVRPFIDSRIIADNIEAVRRYGACNTVVPAVDTLVNSTDGRFINSIPVRSEFYHGQTPQSFNIATLLELYGNMTEEQFECFTDACSVFVSAGKKVFLVEGDRNNIKLTYPEDMEKAENIIKNKENG